MIFNLHSAYLQEKKMLKNHKKKMNLNFMQEIEFQNFYFQIENINTNGIGFFKNSLNIRIKFSSFKIYFTQYIARFIHKLCFFYKLFFIQVYMKSNQIDTRTENVLNKLYGENILK